MDKGALEYYESAPNVPLKKNSQVVKYINTIWEDREENVYSKSIPSAGSQYQQLIPSNMCKR